MHAQNRFWPVMARIFGDEFLHKNNDKDKNAAIAERKDFLKRHHIALWDVLSECEITGASDSSINKELPNDFSEILASSKIAWTSALEKPPSIFTKNTAPKNTARPFPTFRQQALQIRQPGQPKNLQKNIEKRFFDLYRGVTEKRNKSN